MNLDERRRLADANAVAAFSLAAERLGERRGGRSRFGAVDAVAVGIDIAFFNPILAFDPAATAADVLAAVAWVEGRGLPASVQVSSAVGGGVRAALGELGMAADSWASPAMVLEPIPVTPPPPAGVAIRVGGADLFDDWHAATESGQTFRRIFGPAFMDDPAARFAVGYLDGLPVSAAAAIRSGSTVGIYSVATQERARRRGIGRAVTWAAIEAGAAAWSGTIAVLQSSELGLTVYRSMGFEEIATYTAYQRPAP